MSEDGSPRAEDIPRTAVPAPRRGPLPHEKCPHCGVVAVIEPSSTLRFACGVCGKARVPIDDPKTPRRHPEREALARASAAHAASIAWTMAAIASGGFALVSLLFIALAAAAASPGVALVLVAVLAASVPLLFSAWGFRAARAQRAKIGSALDEGWELAARDAVEGRAKISARELGEMIRIGETEAERLLIMLSTDGHVRSRVVDADLEFSSSRAPEPLREAEPAEAEAEAAASASQRERR